MDIRILLLIDRYGYANGGGRLIPIESIDAYFAEEKKQRLVMLKQEVFSFSSRD